ncbi:MAG: hypothetical protein HY736_14315 [Verrucomicrobia bacterium]|nr:hypothetical protein [Verrucomicrobiota bacterium]
MSKRPVTVEDILRLKRAERPGPEFWTQFDRELRAKQLAALVEKRPWWRSLSHAFSGVSRYRLPLGATAILAVTFLAVRESQPSATAPSVAAAPELVASGAGAAAAVMGRPESVATPSLAPEATSSLVRTEATAPDAADQSPRAEATSSAAAFRHVLLLSAASHAGSVAAADVVSSTRYLDAKFAGASASEAMIARNLLGAVRGFETRALPARPAVEPLQQMMTPRDARRTKMLTAMVSMSAEAPAPTGERVARNLPDDRLYDQIQRFSGRGDRLSVRF